MGLSRFAEVAEDLLHLVEGKARAGHVVLGVERVLHVERLAADALARDELGLQARGAVEEHRHATLGRERLREALQELGIG